MSQQREGVQASIHELLSERWSPRAFTDQPVTAEKIMSLFEAARWQASCFNEQPWTFFIATREQGEDYQALFDCLVEPNQAWAQTAPLLILAVAQTQFSRNQKPNRHAQYDTGMAVANLVTEATCLGLHVHQMAGFNAEQARTTLNIPEGCEPMAVMAVGYCAAPESLSDVLQERELAPRTRKDLSSQVFQGSWGITTTLLK